MTWDEILDVVIIGGGVSGLISLKYAKDQNLRAMLLEKEPDLGGLWRKLPEWQDIQIRPEDYSINGLPIEGVDQKNVLKNILSWVDTYKLSSNISSNTAVKKVFWEGSHWIITTERREYLAKHLIVATGLHNRPYIPNFKKENVTLAEFHSSQLFDKSRLKGKKIAIVGGSASAWDLIDLSFLEGASEINWIYRGNRWMLPSTRPKYTRSALRSLAKRQTACEKHAAISKDLQKVLDEKYAYFKVTDIKPTGDFDIDRDVLVGGRPQLIKNFDKIKRYQGEVDEIVGKEIKVSGKSVTADVLLYATGYRMDLQFLGLPELENLTQQEQVADRCSLRFQSLDYPNLYFVGPTMSDSNTSVPFYIATLVKSLVTAIAGKIKLPIRKISHHITHWDLIRELASFDRVNYPLWWRLKYALLARYYENHPEVQIKV